MIKAIAWIKRENAKVLPLWVHKALLATVLSLALLMPGIFIAQDQSMTGPEGMAFIMIMVIMLYVSIDMAAVILRRVNRADKPAN